MAESGAWWRTLDLGIRLPNHISQIKDIDIVVECFQLHVRRKIVPTEEYHQFLIQDTRPLFSLMSRIAFNITTQPSIFLSYISIIVSKHLALATPSINNEFASIKQRTVEGSRWHLRNYLRTIRNEFKLF